MDLQQAAAQYPYFAVACLSLILIVYLLSQRGMRNTYSLNLLLTAMIIWSLGRAFAHISLRTPDALAWYKLSQAGSILMPLTWLFFVLALTGHGNQPDQRITFPLSSISFIFSLLAITNEMHGWFWTLSTPKAVLYPSYSHPAVLGPAGLGSLAYAVALVLTSVVALARKAIQTRGPLIGQAAVLIICALLVPAGYLFVALYPPGTAPLDPIPYLANITAGLFTFGLLHYKLLNLIPLGYESVVSGLRSIILVISPENQIIHANQLACNLLGQSQQELVGQSVKQAFSQYQNLLECCCADEMLTEICLEQDGSEWHYELHISRLNDSHGYAIGKLVAMRDITKRVAAEKASQQSQMMLKQSEEMYRSLIENINEVIFMIDAQGIITYISPTVERYIGYSSETMIGQSFRNYVVQEDWPVIEANLPHALSGQRSEFEFRITERNGAIRYVVANTQVLVQGDNLVSLQGIMTDLTDRHQIELALERRAAQLTLLNDIGEQIASEMELNKLLANAAQLIQTNFGYYHVGIFIPNEAHTEVHMRATSGSYSALFPENHYLKFGQGMVGWTAAEKNMLLSNDVRFEPRYTNLYPDRILTRAELAVPILIGGKLLGVLDIQSPVENAFDENDVRVMKTVADQIAIAMQNAKLYEEARHQLRQREKQENMLRIQRDLLVKLSLEKRLEDTLQTAVQTIASELHASRVTISFVNWENQTIQPIMSSGVLESTSSRPLAVDGDGDISSWVARNSRPILLPDDSAQTGLSLQNEQSSIICVPLNLNGRVIGIIQVEGSAPGAFGRDDLRLLVTLANSLLILIERARLFEEVENARTELEKRATALEEANQNLRELDQLKSQFLANMSHELRTPLNSIIGFSEVLIDQLNGPLNDEQAEFVQDILESGQHLLNLINDLLDFSKIEAGRLWLESSTFQINSLFNELRITVSALVDKKSQVLVFRLEGDEEDFALTADHLRMKQVFINLLSNAIKFTPERGTITVSCRKVEPGWLLFSVSDTGIGIRTEDHELIFEEFRQVDGSLTREVSGTGLGLAISKRIVELHNGRIWVESSLGSGATFFIFIPSDCSSILAENLS